MRKATGFSQGEFAEYIGVTSRTIQYWESGKRDCSDWIAHLIKYKLQHEGLLNNNTTNPEEKL